LKDGNPGLPAGQIALNYLILSDLFNCFFHQHRLPPNQAGGVDVGFPAAPTFFQF
jgi:hypothetical protein